MSDARSIRLVVFDWAGTTVDHGCFAPVEPFIKAFHRYGVELTDEEARGPMGLDKKDHIRALLQTPPVTDRWRAATGSGWTEHDVEEIFSEHFVPLQMASVRRCAGLIDGLLDTVAYLRKRDIKIAGTTGYFREAAEVVAEMAAEQGYVPDVSLCASDVREARPAPWMMFRIMEQLDVYPPAAVVKVGDTVPDIGEGRNAGAWTVGVAASSSDVALTADELAALEPNERGACVEAARQKLQSSGAHYVIDTVARLPDTLPAIEDRLLHGERP